MRSARRSRAPGVAVDVLTRAEHPEQPPCVVVEPGFRVLHVAAGPVRAGPAAATSRIWSASSPTPRTTLLERGGSYDVLHANYWVSGAVGHRLKHELDLPLVTTFHTLDRVKAEVGLADEVAAAAARRGRGRALRRPRGRVDGRGADQLVRHYGADPERIEIISPGVDHRVFSPGDRAAARRHVGLPAGPASCSSSGASNR